jgi:hypothetical protein
MPSTGALGAFITFASGVSGSRWGLLLQRTAFGIGKPPGTIELFPQIEIGHGTLNAPPRSPSILPTD